MSRTVRRTAALGGEELLNGIRDTDENHPQVKHGRHERQNRRFLSTVQTARGHKDPGCFSFQFSLEPERRQLVDLVLELGGYVSEASRRAERIGAGFAEVVQGDQRHALL